MSGQATWHGEREITLNGGLTLTGGLLFHDHHDGLWFAFATVEAVVAVMAGDRVEFELHGLPMRGVVTSVSVHRGLRSHQATTFRIESA